MKYPKLTSLVPEGEHFDAAAVGEGVWLSVAHLQAIEENLAANATSLEANASQITADAENIQALTSQLEVANTNLAAQMETVSERDTRITSLEAQVAELSLQPSGNGTPLSTAADEPVEPQEVPAYLSDSDPINAWADRQMKRKKLTA